MKRAQREKKLRIAVHNLRDYTRDRHKTADDKPFGGGAGMVMKVEPIFECLEAIRAGRAKTPCPRSPRGWTVLMGPQGVPLSQRLVEKLAKKKRLILIAGHYEGVDHRVREHLADQEISIGDFVTMGGEAPALCLIEAVARYVPGVLGNTESLKDESFRSGGLEYPQYTRPREYRGWKVPEVLMSGDHAEVEKWRAREAARLTRECRPDLLKRPRKR